ncbi:MAG TPA: hypothetical protein VEJ41_07885 [Candidatus Acidoferrales bacterium]|nr:hypothetical protein [Candidatus Acidoferrales bacterium]
MKWFVALTLVAASVSLLVPALLRASEAAQNGTLDRIHETAAF